MKNLYSKLDFSIKHAIEQVYYFSHPNKCSPKKAMLIYREILAAAFAQKYSLEPEKTMLVHDMSDPLKPKFYFKRRING